MTNEERENAIRCLKLWIEREPQIQTYKTCLEALEQQPCERFEWGIDGKVYKITKAKDGKEICQQVCDDAISRQAVLDLINDQKDAFYSNGDKCLFELYVNELPSATSKQKYGKWIENAPEYQNIDPPYICSECGNMHLRKTDYCDQCGCRMVEPQERGNKE